MDNTKRFSHKVDDYVKYRPGYPPELFDWLYTEVGFQTSSRIADIGAGTGIFTRYLLERGSKVCVVEPNAPMREAARKYLTEFSGCEFFSGAAEATGLPDAAVDFITCAQSFHWFDRKACRKEFRRILKPGGQVVLVWNRRLEIGGFDAEYEKMLRTIPDYLTSNHKLLSREDFDQFFQPGHWQYRKIGLQGRPLTLEELKGRHQSNSYAAPYGTPEYQRQTAALEDIFQRCRQNGTVTMHYLTEAHLGTF